MNCKNTFYYIIIAACFALSMYSCKKSEPLETVTPKIVQVKISGSTTKDLEFVFKDSVIASGSESAGNFQSTVLLNVAGQSANIVIREKGSTATLESWTISPELFNQSFSIYYDGTGVYEGAVNYHIKGFAMSGELEFLLDGKVISEGALKIDNNLSILINKNQDRSFEIRKKGETTVLMSKVIKASPATGQSLNFFFDGEKLVDDVKLIPPSNPANMSITGQFSSVFTSLSAGAIFKGGDVDLVFYIRNTSGEITVPNPQKRVRMPASGAFVTFELPPLPDDQSFYTYDICEVGTDELPYTDFNSATTYPPKLNKGLYGQLTFDDAYFKAGASKLLLMQDRFTNKRTPSSERAKYIYGVITDLSEYFQ